MTNGHGICKAVFGYFTHLVFAEGGFSMIFGMTATFRDGYRNNLPRLYFIDSLIDGWIGR